LQVQDPNMLDKEKDELLCPSARCEEGHILIGMVREDASVGYIPQRLKVDKNFARKANHDGKAEQRFRFASPCVKSGCQQWTNGQCGVVEDVTVELTSHQTHDLPKCSIRSECRWFAQRSIEACRVCSWVVTDG